MVWLSIPRKPIFRVTRVLQTSMFWLNGAFQAFMIEIFYNAPGTIKLVSRVLQLLQSIEIGGFLSTWSTQGTHFWLPKAVRAPMFWIMECPRHTCFELPEHSSHPCLSYQTAPSYHNREWSALVTQIKIMEHYGHWKNKCPQRSRHYKNYLLEHSNIESKDFLVPGALWGIIFWLPGDLWVPMFWVTGVLQALMIKNGELWSLE